MYNPEVNHYVKWNNGKNVHGWIYFKCHEYLTIELFVKQKTTENFAACRLHKNERVLVLCYREQWEELEFIRKRKSIYDKESMENMG